MTRRYPESSLQSTVVALLRHSARPGVMYLHVRNEGKRDPWEAARLKRAGLKPGAADILLTISGRTHWLELKSATGRQRESQKAFEIECGLCGVPYAIAKSFDEAQAILNGWGAFRETEQSRRAA